VENTGRPRGFLSPVCALCWDDLIFTHISARVPGPEHHFLINPYGLMIREITASSLVKVDLDGATHRRGEYGINICRLRDPSALHAARDDALFIAHFHSPDGMGYQRTGGLLPLNQRALATIPRLSYHDYEGIALISTNGSGWSPTSVTRSCANWRNHGTLALGASLERHGRASIQLESACTAQVRTCDRARQVLIAPQAAQDAVRRQIGRSRQPVDGGRKPSSADLGGCLAQGSARCRGFDS